MNIGTYIGIVLVAGVVFLGFSLIANDMETNLIDTGIVDVEPMSDTYKTNYNQTESIREDFENIEEGFRELGSEGSWWSKLGDFVGAIPLVIIEFPIVVISTLYDSIGNVGTILDELGIPPEIVIIASVGLIIWMIFKLINFWKSGKEI